MNTNYSEIVNTNFIGKDENPISLNEILKTAVTENLSPANNDLDKVLLLAIDVQRDFMDNGALGVPGACSDIERLTQFIYNNCDKISSIACSIDTHIPQQIFHPSWWIDENGNNPEPYTIITLADIDAGKWRPLVNPIASREYVSYLDSTGKKSLCIWTYHCIQGTSGAALENQFSNMIYFHSVARKTVVDRIVKGQDPLSEMYGIIKPEYNTHNYINMNLLNKLEKYDKIIIAGEAKSHCVQESITQILEYYSNRIDITSKIYILEDCMSCIPGFESATEAAFNEFRNQYRVNIVKSTDNIL